MRKLLMAAALLSLAGTGPAAAECSASATTLCLNASRFEIDVSWRDSRGRSGVGQAVSLTADTGYFWFFSEAGLADFDPSNLKIHMYYDPGYPTVLAVETCPGAPPSYEEEPGLRFDEQYYWLHQHELAYLTGGYYAKNWDLLRTSTGASSNGPYIAKKSFARSTAVSPVLKLTEETHLFLKHTPAAPMPNCP